MLGSMKSIRGIYMGVNEIYKGNLLGAMKCERRSMRSIREIKGIHEIHMAIHEIYNAHLERDP